MQKVFWEPLGMVVNAWSRTSFALFHIFENLTSLSIQSRLPLHMPIHDDSMRRILSYQARELVEWLWRS